MRKRINTLSYNTDTAKKLAEYEYSFPSQFDYEHEVLYKKRTGEYFLYGKGGPASQYKSPDPTGGWQEGADIIPLTYKQAEKWYEKANNDNSTLAPDDIYQKEFNTANPDEPKIKTTINLSKLAKRKLEQMATTQGISQGEIVEHLVLNE